MSSLKSNLQNLQTEIQTLAHKYNRPTPTLLAVTKSQSIENIQQAITAQQYAFGENYLSEALPKIAALKNHNLDWHYIGIIQSNKTKHIAENFSWVHTVSNLKIAKRLNEQRPAHLPPLNICIQINISNDPNKAGINAQDAYDLCIACQEFKRLTLRGLMTIPKEEKIFEKQREEFKKLRELFENLIKKGVVLDTLSMGMSEDMEAAIAEGSTMIRIGTKIFGNR